MVAGVATRSSIPGAKAVDRSRDNSRIGVLLLMALLACPRKCALLTKHLEDLVIVWKCRFCQDTVARMKNF